MNDERSWAEKVQSQLRECPICGAQVMVESKDRSDQDDFFTVPEEGDEASTGLMWRVICPLCNIAMYGGNWHKLFKRWNFRQPEQRSRDDVRKLDGKASLWANETKKLKARIEALESILGDKVVL